jgi:hypothetical protein
MATCTVLQPSTARPPTSTAEELLALPDDGIDHYLINGKLREEPTIDQEKFPVSSTNKRS